MNMYENACLMMRERRLRDWIRIRLQDLRRAKFRDVADFAHAAKISQRHVYKIESGESCPTVERLANMLYACDTDLARFFAPLHKDGAAASTRDQHLIDLFNRALLISAKRAAVESLLQALFLDES